MTKETTAKAEAICEPLKGIRSITDISNSVDARAYKHKPRGGPNHFSKPFCRLQKVKILAGFCTVILTNVNAIVSRNAGFEHRILDGRLSQLGWLV